MRKGIKECANPLGMESGRIKDSQLSASSSHDRDSTGPQNSRIRTERGSGAWCPRQQISSETIEWLQIDFDTNVVITAIESQGRFDGGRGLEYAPGYMLEYWRESLGTWARYKDRKQNEVIAGNSDTQSAVLRTLDGGIVARNLRIIPVSEATRTVCMRIELYGCSYKDQLISYAIPEGDVIDGLNLKDLSYDGIKNSSGHLMKGLGKLYDGAVGLDNFEKYPEEWIGWSKEMHGQTITIEMVFAKRKVINAILFHASNFLKSGAQVFNRAHIWFSSQGAGQYSPRTLFFNYVPDKNFQSARWVRIPVPTRIAKELRVELTLSKNSSWLLLSEVKFEFTNEMFEIDDVEDEELDLNHQSNRGDTLTYFAIDDTSDDGTRWISIAVILSLIFLFCALIMLFYLLWIYRRTFQRKGPFMILKKNSKDVRMTIEGRTAKRTSPNAYRMTTDNMQNSLLEKLHVSQSSSSEYAEPNNFSSDTEIVGISSKGACDTAKLLTGSTAHYASSDLCMLRSRQLGYVLMENFATSKMANDYDKIDNRNRPTNFVEIDSRFLRFHEHLGNSRFGEIWLCQLEQRTVVNKTIHRNSDENDRREFELIVGDLSSLRHQNILEVIGVCYDGILKSCIHEYIEQYLGQYLQSLNNELSHRAELLLSVSTQIAAGMSYLESKNFIHGNLSASNCMVAYDGTVKLTNFNMAYELDHFETEHPMDYGRIRWIAWETAMDKIVTIKGDVWSFGVTLWEVLNGCHKYPYKMMTDSDIYKNLSFLQQHGTLKFYLERPDFSSINFYEEFILPCWNRSPEQRPTFHSLHRRLQNVTCTQMSEGCCY
uniref:Protein kinase domain-containing protein n=1 Tax=Setaria digitata TaxID=48799 RepID=A0A915Q0U6_9BILA